MKNKNILFVLLFFVSICVPLMGIKIIEKSEDKHRQKIRKVKSDILNFKDVKNIYLVNNFRAIEGVPFQVKDYIKCKNLKWEIINRNKQYSKEIRIYKEDN